MVAVVGGDEVVHTLPFIFPDSISTNMSYLVTLFMSPTGKLLLPGAKFKSAEVIVQELVFLEYTPPGLPIRFSPPLFALLFGIKSFRGFRSALQG